MTPYFRDGKWVLLTAYPERITESVKPERKVSMERNTLITAFAECLAQQGYYKRYWEFELTGGGIVSHSPEATRWKDNCSAEARRKYCSLICDFKKLLDDLYGEE